MRSEAWGGQISSLGHIIEEAVVPELEPQSLWCQGPYFSWVMLPLLSEYLKLSPPPRSPPHSCMHALFLSIPWPPLNGLFFVVLSLHSKNNIPLGRFFWSYCQPYPRPHPAWMRSLSDLFRATSHELNLVLALAAVWPWTSNCTKSECPHPLNGMMIIAVAETWFDNIPKRAWHLRDTKNCSSCSSTIVRPYFLSYCLILSPRITLLGFLGRCVASFHPNCSVIFSLVLPPNMHPLLSSASYFSLPFT